MFDVGFWELVMIGLVALVVIGPERLPRVARTVGLWAGRARGFLASVKADIDRELNAQELRRVMEEQQKSTGIHEIVEETRSAVDEARDAVHGARDEFRDLGRTPQAEGSTTAEAGSDQPQSEAPPAVEAPSERDHSSRSGASEGESLPHESTVTPTQHHHHEH